MNINGAVLSLTLITMLLAIGCDVSDLPAANQLSRTKEGWYSDTRPTQLGLDTIDINGLSLSAEDSDAKLFIDCNLHFATIDWSDAILIASGDTIRTDEVFLGENERRSSSYYEWYGSSFSRKRVVRDGLSTSFVGEFVYGMGTMPKAIRGEFLRGLEQDVTLEISQGDNSARWKLEGFRNALGNHCS